MMIFAPLLKRFPKTDPDEPNWRRPILGLVAAVLLLASLPLFYQGWFTRWVGWDYCAIAWRNTQGFWPAVQHLAGQAGYSYPAAVLSVLTGLAGQYAPRVSVILSLLFFFSGLFLLVHRIGKAYSLRFAGLEAIDLAAAAGFLAVFTAADAGRLFYWPHTVFISSLPVTLWLFLLARLLGWAKQEKKIPAIWLVFAAFIGSVVTGSFALPQAAFQSLLYTLIVIFSTIQSDRTIRLIALSGLAGSVMGGVLLGLTQMPVAGAWLSAALPAGIPTAAGLVAATPVAVIVVAVMAFSLAMLTKQADRLNDYFRLLGLIPVTAGLALAAARLGAVNYPDAASWLRRLALFLGLAAWFHVLGCVYQIWRRRSPRYVLKKDQVIYAIAIVLLGFFTMNGSIGLLTGSAGVRAATEVLDERAVTARMASAEGKEQVVFEPVALARGIEDLSADPLAGINQCAAEYYDVQQVQVRQP
jgi:hypothetical protein